jgi:peroxiredoxin (alkyl hydroperoxide reductase subunit C)
MSLLLLGQPAPSFSAKAVIKDTIISDFCLESFLGKYVVLFFYPLDFTFVCPTELHAFQEYLPKFQERGVEIIGCSVDSPYTHLAWLQSPKTKGGIEGITYPLVSDLNKSIAKKYYVLDEKEGIAYRGLFIIDPKGIVRHVQINDLPIGRSMEETLRTIDAILFHAEHGEVCPAGWQKGKKSMQPTAFLVIK